MHILVTQVMDVPERDTSQDKQFSKEKDVPGVSLGHPQGALVHQNRDTEHQAMVGTIVDLQHKYHLFPNYIGLEARTIGSKRDCCSNGYSRYIYGDTIPEYQNSV